MRAILLPTDFSKNSINAIHYAVKLFELDECNFYILNVQKASQFISDDLMSVSTSATIYNTLVDAAKKSIINIISQIEKSYNNENHTFHSLVDYDNFIDSINQNSKLYGIDLIVMGTKGATGFEKVLFGSNTVHVMQRCDLPVLAIPEGCKFKKLDVIAFTTSFSSTYAMENLETLNYLINVYKAKLNLVHVITEPDFEEELYSNLVFFQSNFINMAFDRIILKENDIYKTIHKYIIKNDIKMISMFRKKHSFVERLFTRHTLETFGFNIDVPFLVM